MKMNVTMTLSPAPLTALQLDDLQAVSGGGNPQLWDPIHDEENRQQLLQFDEILRGQGDNKLGQ